MGSLPTTSPVPNTQTMADMKNVAAVDFAGQSYLFFVDGSQISFYVGPAASESKGSYNRYSFNLPKVQTHPDFYKIAAVSWKTSNGAELRLYFANTDGELVELTRSSGPNGVSDWGWGKLQAEDYKLDPASSGLSAVVNDTMTRLYYTPPKGKTVWVASSPTVDVDWSTKVMVKLNLP
ncbi:hypothetical protein BDV96DRAFT_650547 [Lophiotrema nucula]|uniref:Fucose-specific lectin n=1 Tax=Lophiotrema nucula TaxID=690887 RepID=A0A6A5YVP0_9PLEO|nr:hypothetical protein BDV96DRAFT_650547 [Lophiotrema nucula]